MHLFRANPAASRIGSPATNGTANAVSNRIWVPASSDNAFSEATIASTNAAPVIDAGCAPVNAVSDSAVAGAPASIAQSAGGVSPLGCWSFMVPPPEGVLASRRLYVRIVSLEQLQYKNLNPVVGCGVGSAQGWWPAHGQANPGVGPDARSVFDGIRPSSCCRHQITRHRQRGCHAAIGRCRARTAVSDSNCGVGLGDGGAHGRSGGIAVRPRYRDLLAAPTDARRTRR